jgi:hypothetical protein
MRLRTRCRVDTRASSSSSRCSMVGSSSNTSNLNSRWGSRSPRGRRTRGSSAVASRSALSCKGDGDDLLEMDFMAQIGAFVYLLGWFGERKDLRNRIDDTRFLDVVSKICLYRSLWRTYLLFTCIHKTSAWTLGRRNRSSWPSIMSVPRIVVAYCRIPKITARTTWAPQDPKQPKTHLQRRPNPRAYLCSPGLHRHSVRSCCR